MMNEFLKDKDLNKLVQELAWNDGYGCYTRGGFEKMIWPQIAPIAKWIIFFDVDNMHELNAEHGYEGVNAIIKKSLAMRETDYMAGQWFSGDEFIVCITDSPDRDLSNPIGFAMRLAEIFRENGAPATFAIAPVRSSVLFESVTPAYQAVQKSKDHHQRGTISIVGAEVKL
jgi:hypothetical protein